MAQHQGVDTLDGGARQWSHGGILSIDVERVVQSRANTATMAQIKDH